MEEQRFWDAWSLALREAHGQGGIGTLSEKRLHAALKHYYAKDASHLELPLGRYIADVFDGEKITEIQTGSFRRLKPKLEAFLPEYPVRIVYPIAASRRTVWTDPETGETTAPHTCRKRPHLIAALHELYAIAPFLCAPGLQIELLLIDMEEHRLLDGTGPHRKKGATRLERVPCALPTSILLQCPEDYRIFLPEALPERFTAAMFGSCTKLHRRALYSAIHVLETVGLLEQDGTEGRAVVYRLAKSGANASYSASIPTATSPENRS